MGILNNFASIYCFITFVLGAVFMLAMIIIAAMGKVDEPRNEAQEPKNKVTGVKLTEPRNKVRFFVTQEYGVHCLKLWMGKPELNEKKSWVSRSDTVHFLCDDFYNGNRNLFENYNLNPRDFADMKEGEIREVFINLED